MARKRKDPLRRKRHQPEKPLNRQDQIQADLKRKATSGHLTDKRWGFTATKLEKADTCVHKTLYSAKAFFDALVDGSDWKWVKDKRLPKYVDRGIIETSDGVRIHAPMKVLEEIVSYKMKPKELEYWQVSDEQLNRIRYIRSDQAYVAPAPRTEKVRHVRKGMIKADKVADQMGVTPKELRSMLRKSKIEKPEHGWAWRTQEDVDKVIQSLTSKDGHVRVNFKGVKKPE